MYSSAGIDDVHSMQEELCGQREMLSTTNYLPRVTYWSLPYYFVSLKYSQNCSVLTAVMPLDTLALKIFDFALGLINSLPFTASLTHLTYIKTNKHYGVEFRYH